MSGQGGVRQKGLHHVCADCLDSVCRVSVQCVCVCVCVCGERASERASNAHSKGRSSLTGGPGQGEKVCHQRGTIRVMEL